MRRALSCLALMSLPLAAGASECRLALVMAVDVSSSVDATEDRLQRQGLAAALRAPDVAEAFFVSPQPVAIAAYEWSGKEAQDMLLDWTLIDSLAQLERAARQIAGSTRQRNDAPTAMGHALAFGARLLARAPGCLWQVIDLAGDGRNNHGFGPKSAYRAYDFSRITVNGLVVNAADFEGELDLIPFFQRNVLHGPGAFLEVAQGFEDYENAMRRKLIQELALRTVSGIPLSSNAFPG